MFLVLNECYINLSSKFQVKRFFNKSLHSIPTLSLPIKPKKRVRRLSDECFSDADQSDSIPPFPPPIIMNMHFVIIQFHVLKENILLISFPWQNKKAQMNCQITYNIYCVCRLPESSRIICCNLCNKWYQDVCVNTPKEAWEKRNL